MYKIQSNYFWDSKNPRKGWWENARRIEVFVIIWGDWRCGRVLNCEYLKQFRDGARRRESGSGKNSVEFYDWLNLSSLRKEVVISTNPWVQLKIKYILEMWESGLIYLFAKEAWLLKATEGSNPSISAIGQKESV